MVRRPPLRAAASFCYSFCMELVLPDAKYKDSFIEAVKEFQADESVPRSRRWYLDVNTNELKRDLDSFVEKLLSEARGENLPEGFVPQSNYWLVEGKEYIGGVRIRHYLNDHLLVIGGHIGYSIRPSKRGKGYGTKLLTLALPKAKELGLERVLVTCDATNEASRKIIEKNGGVFEDQVPNPETGIDKLRYWIDIA
jgi:predicted acetyltransferase